MRPRTGGQREARSAPATASRSPHIPPPPTPPPPPTLPTLPTSCVHPSCELPPVLRSRHTSCSLVVLARPSRSTFRREVCLPYSGVLARACIVHRRLAYGDGQIHVRVNGAGDGIGTRGSERH